MKTGDMVYSITGEVFNYDTPDFDIGDTYYSGKVVTLKPSDMVHRWTVDNILEQMDETLYEEVGECAYNSLYLPDEDKIKLTDIIKNFMDTHTEVGCYKVEDIEEHRLEE